MTQIRGVWGAVEDDGTTAWRNRIEDIRSLLWDLGGQAQGIIRGFDVTLDAGSLSMTFSPGSAVVEEKGTDTTGDDRAYYVFNDVDSTVTFDTPDAASRNDAVVFCWADAQYGALGASVVTPGGPQIAVVKGVSGTTTARTDSDISTAIGPGGWFRYADVVIDPGDTEVNPANVTYTDDPRIEAELHLELTGSQTISGNNLTRISWGTATGDTDLWDGSTDVTVPRDGVYALSATCQWDGDGTSAGFLGIRVNGSHVIGAGGDALINNYGNQRAASTTLRLSAGDVIDFTVFQNSGGNLNIQDSGGAATRADVVWLRP